MGSIYKSTKPGKNGTIRETWTIDFHDAFGKRKRKDFKTKSEGLQALAKLEMDIKSGSYAAENKKLTFTHIATEYMELHAEIHCKPSTIKGYKANINCHIIPTLGQTRLMDLSRRSIEMFIQEKQKQKLSPKTINNCLTLIGSIIQRAMDNNLIGQNPALKVKKLSVPHQEMRVLNIDEIHRVLEVAKKEYPDFHPLLLTAIMTGMRRGEILGLTWDRINWQKKFMFITKSLYKDSLVEPKTPAAIRKINMSDELIKTLKEWKLRCPVSDLDLVFPNSDGNPMDADNMVKRRFVTVLRKAGIDILRFHDLRHTFVSLLIAKGVQPKYIQKQVGHTSIQVTMDRYGHLLPEVDQQGFDAINSILRKESNDSKQEAMLGNKKINATL